MPSQSLAQFKDQVAFVEQLIAIHGKLQSGQGRRHEQEAIHRAGVVMMVAAWQSYVEKLIMEGVSSLELNAGLMATTTPPVPAWARHAFALRRAEIAIDVKKFNTPNDTGVRDLLMRGLEFNPWPIWCWHAGPRQWESKEIRDNLNNWVLIRHSVAHGFPLPASIAWLKDSHGRARLTLSLLKECKRFFEHLVAQTDSAFSDFLHTHHGIPKPW